ncbi:tRNA uridine-5-carboxymethylaminomethyl(34) synthesis enzyme MnmG, partial [Candidatus Sumerlaeota bacterium]|nr:tRNA uridine-5-carboxymethylaminomethyl(34) synthesis enzyme MnmG [Candidatus Sumerlaeota bacterium]
MLRLLGAAEGERPRAHKRRVGDVLQRAGIGSGLGVSDFDHRSETSLFLESSPHIPPRPSTENEENPFSSPTPVCHARGTVERYDVIVIGGGHAGIEAAHAAARLGARTLLATGNLERVAWMPCNPAIGGLAKGHLVREIDALGGLMGRAADACGIQFRLLNRSKGPAVQGPRAQMDKHAYRRWVLDALSTAPNLTVREMMVVDLIMGSHLESTGLPVLQRSQRQVADAPWDSAEAASSHSRRRKRFGDGAPPHAKTEVSGVVTSDGTEIAAGAVILTAGTFLDGLCHVGLDAFEGGRGDEPAAKGLADAIARAGIQWGRLKTGTPARLAGDSVDLDRCEIQPGDEVPVPFSFLTDAISRDQAPCHLTWTNERTHAIIRAAFDRSPLFTGVIESVGPRYCPSIETKIDRFPDRPRHQIFLEPDDLETGEIYPNGVSTSLPRDVQEAFLRTIPGMERCVITRPGYAVEYTFFPPTQLRPTLESKRVVGLWFAGQVNGTSGYEEAAAQGLMAGINAALALGGREPLVLRRDQAYIGVLIDDLVTKGTNEPYRMFTSRAEHRLTLAHHSADVRLTPIGREIGLVDDERWERFEKFTEHLERLRARSSDLESTGLPVNLCGKPPSDLESTGL